MRRTTTILVTIAMVTVLVAVPFGASAGVTDDGDRAATDDENATESVAPGERLTGVVGVQNAEIDGEVSDRTFGVKIANAESDAAKADVVGDRLEEIEERLDEHETALDELEATRESGDMSHGEYRAKVATVAAETAATERAAESANAAAGELPREILEERGVDVDAIEELRDRASELGGPETAEIARSIAGENVGSSIGGADAVTPIGTEDDRDSAADGAAGNESADEHGDRGDDTERGGQGR